MNQGPGESDRQCNDQAFWRRMKTPPGLQALIDDGVVDEVMRPLKSGKEAAVYVVRAGREVRCAKVYKDMAQRSFQQRVQYQEGR
jgi:RIO kinase 1